MNQLAYIVYRLITGSEMERTTLDASKRAAVVKLYPVLDHGLDDLAVKLSGSEVQAEEWLRTLPAAHVD